MKDKLKAYIEKAKTDPYTRGILVGGVVGIASTVGTAIVIGANFDRTGVYIPDAVIDQIREHGPILARKDGLPAVVLCAFTPES